MNRLHKAFAVAALSLATTAAVAGPVSAQGKIGVVDMQRALHETEDGRAAKAKLKKLFEARQKTLDKQQNELRTMKESLEKQQNVLSKEVLAKKFEEYQKKFAALQSTYVDFQRELAAKEGELTQHILERMQRIVKHLGQKEGYSLVVERNEGGVVYVPSSYDLTDLLIQRYNAGEGKGPSDAKAKSSKKASKKK
ncbi:MAG: OmpH family outer membrane protein [Myxococcales bacterium]|nr:OmpH family outer membrane protein [Myxococcales bacterium]